ncbi:uroporphyrinogen-III C-methyltransferase [Endothiovibrio diazotrophicus]
MTARTLPAQLDERPESPPPENEPPTAEQSEASPTEPSSATPSRERRSGGAAAWLALLTALAVAGWNGHQYLEQGRRDQGERALLNDQARRIGELEHKLALNERESATRSRTLEERQRALQETLSGLRTLAGLHGRNGWVVAEAEYLVRLARHTLRVKEDATTAIALLRDADRRLAELGDPALHTPRTLLAADVAALESLPPAPLSAHSAALGRLIDQVETLPLPIPHTPADAPAGAPEPPADRWQWRDWLDQAERWLKQSVVVRRDGDPPRPLIAPAERYFLTENLRLTLETARLALYREDPAGFRDALARARRWIVAHFDGAAPSTRITLRELARLEQAPLQRPLPDLGETLEALTTVRNTEAESGERSP